jgi:hypothetical protein
MTRRLRVASIAALLLSVSTLLASAPPGIELVGIGYVGGSLLDKSGLTGNICQAGVSTNCVPKAVLGGFGSAMTYTGHDDVFVAAPDRGPFDGLTDVPFLDRVHFFHITTDIRTKQISTVLLDTRFLKNEFGQTFVGAAGAFDTNNPLATLRLDPEGIRVGSNGNMYISDEYGPYLFEFDRQGSLVRRIDVPAKFSIANPSADPNAELLGNSAGRQANRGMEGLAISPDGFTLFGMMQNALLQDAGIAGANAVPPALPTDRVGLNNRILKVDLVTGETHEYVYHLDAINRGQGVSEILAINDHQFLVVERDNRSWFSAPPQAPTRKSIYKIDLTGATDVSGKVLPADALPAGVVPVQKTLFINLIDPDFGLGNHDDKAIAEKIEGLAWGPDLPDGRHVLYVTSDNDLITANPTQIYAFAIDTTKLTPALAIDFQTQVLPGPFFPPGQVKKIVGK